MRGNRNKGGITTEKFKARSCISVGYQVLLRKNAGGYSLPSSPIEKANTPRSYNIQTKDGAVYRRTSRHLNKPIPYSGDMPRTAIPDVPPYKVNVPCTTIPDVPPYKVQGAQTDQARCTRHAEQPATDIRVAPPEESGPPLQSRQSRVCIKYDA